MYHEPLKLKNIYLKNQNVNTKIMKELLHNLYKNIRFSTFPYLTYKAKNSQEALNRFNSGNCIALTCFIKKYLKQNYNIDSYIIGASVPPIFKVENTPEICHCAICIPINSNEFYILDGAFYFIEPMYCNLSENIKRSIINSDIYNHENSTINYIVDICNCNNIDENFNQELLNESLCVACYFQYDVNEKWNYYLNEVLNPDESIGSYFLEKKHLPFLLYTDYDFQNNVVKLLYKIFIDEEGDIVFKKYPNKEILFKGNINEIYKYPKIYNLLQENMNSHFDNYIV